MMNKMNLLSILMFMILLLFKPAYQSKSQPKVNDKEWGSGVDWKDEEHEDHKEDQGGHWNHDDHKVDHGDHWDDHKQDHMEDWDHHKGPGNHGGYWENEHHKEDHGDHWDDHKEDHIEDWDHHKEHWDNYSPKPLMCLQCGNEFNQYWALACYKCEDDWDGEPTQCDSLYCLKAEAHGVTYKQCGITKFGLPPKNGFFDLCVPSNPIFHDHPELNGTEVKSCFCFHDECNEDCHMNTLCNGGGFFSNLISFLFGMLM